MEEGVTIGNTIKYDDRIEKTYLELCNQYEPSKKAAPFFKPFYHLINEGFYSIKWLIGAPTEHTWHTPSAKFLRENVDYAYLDDGLWDLLQDGATRAEFRTAIISHFLISEK